MLCSAQSFSCVLLFGPRDCSPPGSSVHGIFQARILEQITIFYSRRLPDSDMELASLASPYWQADFLPLAPPGKPILHIKCYNYHQHQHWQFFISATRSYDYILRTPHLTKFKQLETCINFSLLQTFE